MMERRFAAFKVVVVVVVQLQITRINNVNFK